MFVLLAFAVSVPPTVAPAPRLVGEAVELKTPTGTLFGTIDLPATPGPWPVVLIHAGSGPTNRDGNQLLLRNDNLKQLGRGLAAKGIAALRIDKRGVAASRAALTKEADIRVDHYAADLTAWVAVLRKDRRFTTVAILGHSEGALIGLIAAADAKPDAFVSLCGPGRRLQDVLREQLKARLPKELYEASDSIITELEAGRAVKDVPDALKLLFRPSVQPYLISEFKYDPVKLIAGVRVPVLVIGGTTDIQVPAADARRLASARPGTRVIVLKDMNHVLKVVAKTDLADQLPSYSDPALPLHPQLVDEIARFLKASAGK